MSEGLYPKFPTGNFDVTPVGEVDRAWNEAIEAAAKRLELGAEEIKHTRHVDGLGMGWIAGEDLLVDQATRVRALSRKVGP